MLFDEDGFLHWAVLTNNKGELIQYSQLSLKRTAYGTKATVHVYWFHVMCKRMPKWVFLLAAFVLGFWKMRRKTQTNAVNSPS